jgi:hypothetical protein
MRLEWNDWRAMKTNWRNQSVIYRKNVLSRTKQHVEQTLKAIEEMYGQQHLREMMDKRRTAADEV